MGREVDVGDSRGFENIRSIDPLFNGEDMTDNLSKNCTIYDICDWNTNIYCQSLSILVWE